MSKDHQKPEPVDMEPRGSIPLMQKPWAIITAFFHKDVRDTLFDTVLFRTVVLSRSLRLA